MTKRIISFCLILAFLFQPLVSLAQTTTSPSRIQCPDGTYVVPPPTGPGCSNTNTTNQTLQHFNPAINVDIGGQNNFGGINFSGVGGAVLGCANIGDSIVSDVSEIFKSSKKKFEDDIQKQLNQPMGYTSDGSFTEQPVTDRKATEEIKKQTQRENCLNGMAYAVAKNTLQQMSNKTLNWVNTGFNGNPFFVKDIDSYLSTVKNEKISEYLTNVQNSDPIFGNALRSSITQIVTGRDDGRINEVMNTPQAKAYQDFQSDFTKGGWPAFLNMNNNPIGAFFKASDRISSSVNNAQQNVKDELQQGDGFLSMKRCAEYRNSSSGRQECIRYETITPGAIIAAQTSATTTSPIRQAEQADQINEVLGSFFDGLVNRFFAQGLSSLSGVGGSTTIGYSGNSNIGQNVVIGSNGLAIQNPAVSIEDAFGYQRASGGFFGEFDISRPQQVRAVLKTQKDFYNVSADAQVAMSTLVPSLGKLDYCFPGPNPTWTVGTNYNFNLFMNGLQGKKPDQTLGNTITTLSSAAMAIPGPGPIIAAVGNVVGGILNMFNADGGLKEVSTPGGFQLFDKVTNQGREISKYWLRRGSNVELIPFLGRSYDEVIRQYQEKFNLESITRSFIATGLKNESDTRGMVSDIYNEIGTITYYNQAFQQYKKTYTEDTAQTIEAINTLESINDEVIEIVARAKERYIKERASAGTPVDMSCLNEAYNINRNEVQGAVRMENGPINPNIQKSQDASVFFYNHI